MLLTNYGTGLPILCWCVVEKLLSVISVIITTLIIHHPIILPFQTQNFPISQILPSIDIWHLFGLISRIPELLYGFFSVSVFFLVSVIVISFRLSFSVLGLLSLP